MLRKNYFKTMFGALFAPAIATSNNTDWYGRLIIKDYQDQTLAWTSTVSDNTEHTVTEDDKHDAFKQFTDWFDNSDEPILFFKSAIAEGTNTTMVRRVDIKRYIITWKQFL